MGEGAVPSGAFPLSPAQMGMWLAQHADPSVPINIAQYVDINGSVDADVLERALITAARELGSGYLRLFEIGSEPYQIVDLDLDTRLHRIDLRSEPDPIAAAHAWMRADFGTPIDVVSDRLVLSALLRLDDEHYYWYSRAHHIAFDGFGAMTFMDRGAALYTAEITGTEPTPSRAGDLRELAADETAYRDTPRFTADREYWLRQVSGIEEGVSLSGRTAPPAPANDVSSLALSDDVESQLGEAIERNDSSLANLVIAAFAAYLSQATDRTDVVLSLPVTARTTARTKHSGGMVSNVVPLRIQLGPEVDIADLLTQVRVAVTGALRHQRYRHEDIRRDAKFGQGRRAFFGPLINVMLFHNEVTFGHATGRLNVLSTGIVEDLSVNIYQSVAGTRTHIDFESNANLYPREEVAVHHRRFLEFFETFIAAPSTCLVRSLSITSSDEIDIVTSAWNLTTREVSDDATLASMLDEQVARTPRLPAVTFEGETLTFAEFDDRVGRLARFLIDAGVRPDDRVGVVMRRSLDLLVTVHAIVRAGGAYVPVDPDQPVDRIRHIVSTADPTCIITDSDVAIESSDGAPQFEFDDIDLSAWRGSRVTDRERNAPLCPDNIAYVIFTSGSTGQPKGVAVTHRSIVNRIEWMQHEYGLTRDDVVLHKTPTTFDVSVWELFWSLFYGARLVVAQPEGHRDPEYLRRVILRESVTTVHFVPSMLAVFATEFAAECRSLRNVFASGEALPAATAQRVRELVPGVRVHNLYGPTEAAVDVTYHEVDDRDRTSVPIGRPVWNTRVLVLDSLLRPVPIGIVGELYLGGRQLARGYIAQEVLTAERFVADPIGSPGERLYRTGDLVYWTESGELEYVGRRDFQVKLRGQRIELAEIEHALLNHPAVSQATVAVVSGPTGEQLVGYVVPASEADVTGDELRRTAAQSLPGYMVPTSVLIVDSFPVNASGKLDRKALPKPVFGGREYRAPSTQHEQLIAAMFGDVLGISTVGADDNFFELGGDSLVATQVVARINAAYGVHIGVRALFEAETPAELAERVAAEKGGGTNSTPPLVRISRSAPIPLSLAQQRMWFLNKFDPSAVTYNLPFVVRMTGRVELAPVAAALRDVVDRHESLRTVFPENSDGLPEQVVLPMSEVEFDVPVEQSSETELPTQLRAFAAVGFDVTTEIPIRARMFRLADDSLALAIVVHHIAADGFSFGPLAHDTMRAYTARIGGSAPEWEALPVQYADYSVWQRQLLGSEEVEGSLASRQIKFWESTLAGLPDQLDLPTDRPRPATQSFRGKRVQFEIPADLYARFVGLARANNTTPFMAFHAAFVVLLARLASTDDVVVGTPVAGRGEQALDALIGMFVNTLVLRTQVEATRSFVDLLDSVRESDLQAFGHSDLPFERLVEVLNPPRSQSRHPLFQVILAFQKVGPTAIDLPDLSIRAEEVVIDVAKFDLQLTVTAPDSVDMNSAVTAEFVYAEDLFEVGTVESFARRLVRVLEAVTSDPDGAIGDIGLLENAEIALLAPDAGTRRDPFTLAEMLAEVSTFDPEATAIVLGDSSLTYSELDARSSRLARKLVAEGVGAGDVVAIAIPRSIESVLSVWAIAKSGAAFVPVDPGYPTSRIEYMVTDSAAVLGLTVSTVADGLPNGIRWLILDGDPVVTDLEGRSPEPVTASELVRPIRIDDAAYLIYTSGSTGTPKGVVVTNRGLATQVGDQRERFGVDSSSRVLHFASPSFDASVLEFLLAFGGGATMVVAPTSVVGGAELADLLRTSCVTHAFITPAALASVDPADLDDLRVIMVGGDACTRDLVARWSVGRSFFNLYGPTETTIVATSSAALTGHEPTVPIGTALRGAPVYVLDSRLNLVPAGVAGELYVGGETVARGYHGRFGLTAERFIADPFSNGGRLYRTGDLVRWVSTPDGSRALEFVGRSDFQVKIRGHRIELGELDATFTSLPEVDFAVTVGQNAFGHVPSLVTYVVLVPGVRVDGTYLREAVARVLPRYMVPAAVVVLDEIPLTPAGKLDRKALPDPVFETRVFRAPSTPIEEIVANVFADVLGVERIGVDDDFFDLGGNSLSATQVASRLGTALAATVSVRTIFEAPTVGALAVRVESWVGVGGRPALVAGGRPEQVPLSLAQQRMWFLNRIDTESSVNNIPIAIRLSGHLDVAALQVAVLDVVDRHESLRTVFPETPDGAAQVIRDAVQVVPNLSPVQVEAGQLAQYLIELVSVGFDVTTEVPLHARLFQLGETEYVLAMVVHHISADGWSMGPLARDVMVAYASRSEWEAPSWAPLPVQYADYALWQRALLGSEDDPDSLISRQLAFWTSHLLDLPDHLDLPSDRVRPAVATYTGGRVEFTVASALHGRIDELARQHGATPFMVMHAALVVLLSRLSGTDDIVVGTPVAGRGEAALDDLIGMFVNTLVLRTKVSATESFGELLGKVSDVDLAAFSHSDVPFERLVEVLNPVRSQAHHPLFQVMLAFQNMGHTSFELPGLSISRLDMDSETSKFDLSLTLSETFAEDDGNVGISAAFTFARDLFDDETVREFAERFIRILEAAVADPKRPVGEIDLLSGAERRDLLLAWNDSVHAVDEMANLVSLFEAQVSDTPDAIALRFGEISVTYRDFDARVNRLARYLLSTGVGPETAVAIAMHRGIELLVAVYAVLKAGAAYVPVDPDLPASRIGYIVETAEPVCVLTAGGADLDRSFNAPVLELDDIDLTCYSADTVLPAERPGPLRPDNTAYVIFTSGSTGRPKGVAVSHRAIVNQMLWRRWEYALDSTDVVLHKTPITFDVSVWELFWPLQSGAQLVIAEPDGHRDPAYLVETIRRTGVTTVHFVPSMLDAFAAEPGVGECISLRHVFSGGEAFSTRTATRLRELLPGTALHNLYGPAEAAVDVTYHRWTESDGSIVPIGVPVWNTRCYVLDDSLSPVAVGVVGELYLAGVQLARGYVGAPGLTAERFVADPFGPPGTVLYRTGDLVRWTREGELIYVGRTDFQVKLRGQRIELGEVDAALEGVPTIARAASAIRQGQLVAYVVPSSGSVIDVDATRAEIGRLLPGYMVPTRLVVLDSFPLNASGKLDRRALPDPDVDIRVFRRPATPTEEVVANVFADVLSVDRVGRDDDFFALGGNSLIATRVVARIGAALGVRIPIRTLFEASGVAPLAALVDGLAGESPTVPLVPQPRTDRISLSIPQQRMWFLNRFDTDSAVNNVPVAIRLAGSLDVSALRSAVHDVLDRHEVLRTRYPEYDGVGYQEILSADSVHIDLEPHPVEASGVLGAVVECVSEGFDVTVEPPVRSRLLRVSDTEHILVFVVHHIATDGFSMAPLTRDIMLAYESRSRGVEPAWRALPVQYADFALWQREVLGSSDNPDSLLRRQEDYWLGTLAELPDEIGLPTDRPRPAVASNRGATLEFTIDGDLHAALVRLARSQGVTMFMVMHSALVVLLGRLSGSRDVVIGSPLAGRGEQALDDLVGMFVNTVVLRTGIQPDESFADVLDHVRSVDLEAFGHSDVPFERLVELINPARSQGRHPLFQVLLAFQNHERVQLELPGLHVEPFEFDAAIAKFDLQLTLFEAFREDGREAGITGLWTYAVDLFDEVTVREFADRYLRLLRVVVSDPNRTVGDIALLDAAEQATITERWSGGGGGAQGNATLAELFDAQVARTPDRVALTYGEESLTYRELAGRARKLARRLIADGVGPESFVGVALPRSVDLVTALLAVVETGAAYVPLDVSAPADRIAYIVEDSAPVCVLTWSGNEIPFGDHTKIVEIDRVDLDRYSDAVVAVDERTRLSTPDTVAYVIYTSGSTGRPKGVMVSHRNVVRLMADTEQVYGFGPDDVWTMFHSYAFDFSVWELWGPLLHGGRLVVVDYYTTRSPHDFLDLLVRERVTVLNQTPSAFYQLAEVDRSVDGDLALRYVIFGGEALELRRLSGWFARRGDRRPELVNMYGITETTVHVSYRRMDSAIAESSSASLIGEPIAGLRVYVLDSRLNPVPAGVAGELYIAGGQLARGYLARPSLTAARFVANPFGADGSLLYRTGDVARWNRAGELEYLGRADDQVKVRGFRIELGEIAAVVSSDPAVSDAAVIVREDIPGDQRIVAYVVAVDGMTVDTDGLRTRASEQLPEYMIPSAFVVLDGIPLTVNGKLDRRALPVPAFASRAFRAPTTPIEQVVAEAFADVLSMTRIGLDDDFFELGGNSLAATKVVSRIGAALDTRVPVRTFFEASTVEALASAIESHVGAGRGVRLAAGTRPERIPLSLAQTRMWFLNRFDSESTAYNIPLALRLRGHLDSDALAAAVSDLIDRHESLRTVYPDTDAGPTQQILPNAFEIVDLAPQAVDRPGVRASLLELMRTRFDVTSEVPVRIRLFALAPDEHILAAVVHHISADGSSLVPFARDLMTAYSARVAGTTPIWEPLAVQFADYALWQRSVLGDESDPESVAARQLDYWRAQLSDQPEQLDLPTDRPRPAVQSFVGGRVAFRVPAGLHTALNSVARSAGATLFMAVHAAFTVLLARLAASDDISVGTPIAGRGERELDDVIGMFVNTLVLRTAVDTNATFAELLDDIRETDLQAFAHADLPFERLVEVLNPTRSTARHPLFQVGFSFQNQSKGSFALHGLEVAPVDIDSGLAQFDLHLIVTDEYGDDGQPAGLDATFTYASDLFDRDTVEGIAARFIRVLETVAANVDQRVGEIDILEPGERTRILDSWNSTVHPVRTEATLVSLFDEQVAVASERVAVVASGTRLTFGELDARVNRLARHLLSSGIGPEALVGLAMRRSVDLIIGMYAVVKAGGVYVPLDPDQPAERIADILATADPGCILTTERDEFGDHGSRSVILVDSVDLDDVDPGPIRPEERRGVLVPDSAAYVIFTSGSTGRPKGVTVSHRAIVNQLLWKRDRFDLGATDAVLLKTVATFDLSVWEFWSAAVSGAKLVVADADGHRDPAYLVSLIEAEGVTTLHVVPSMLEALLVETGGALPSALRRVLAIGEELPVATAQRFLSANTARLFNLYGPTEAAVSITEGRVAEPLGGTVPIGRPVWNSKVYVLDSNLRPVPPGVTGELYLAGAQLARGYHGRGDLTAERFVADPFASADAAGTRMYRTGDLVRWTGSGELDYVGRADFQVKVRGYRIELGDIESAIRGLPDVDRAVATVYRDDRTGDRIVGYVVPAIGSTIEAGNLRTVLRDVLPSYMVPAAIVVMDALPLNINGKIDRKALPNPVYEAREFVAPSTPAEEVVATVFAELLGVSRVGVEDDFFELGGNSLIATRLVARLGEELDARIPVRAVFEASTVRALTARAESEIGKHKRVTLAPRARPDEVPLSFAQQRMWVLNQVDPASSAYNIPVVLRLSGLLDVTALRAAVGDIVVRHEVLRTLYPDGTDGPIQRIEPVVDSMVDVPMTQVDEHDLVGELEELIGAGFDVARQIPIRMRLFELSPTEFVLVVVVHHISADGFSMGPMTRDLLTAYQARVEGRVPHWAPLPVQYADYALWQREVLGSEDDPNSSAAEQLSYWVEELSGVPELLQLPTDRPRPARQSMQGASYEFEVDEELSRRIDAVARETHSTVFMVVHAALAVLLAKLSKTSDIAIGTPIAGRGERALDDLIGMFVNTLVLRTNVAADASFEQLLNQVREKDLAAFAHAELPFERIVDALGRSRTNAYSPLFQVMLSYQNTGDTSVRLPGLEVSAFDHSLGRAKVDLQMSVAEEFDVDRNLTGMRILLTYATDLFDEETVAHLAERFLQVLGTVTTDPSATVRSVDVRTEQEREESTPRPTTKELPELIGTAARCAPGATAFEHGGSEFDFATLDMRITAVAQAMGANLAPEAKISVALSGLVPGILPALGVDGFAQFLERLVARSIEVVKDARSVETSRMRR
ncbi:non-ribosomal peptide synthase/polyketide synthase [Rhodococcus pyridinivorans]